MRDEQTADVADEKSRKPLPVDAEERRDCDINLGRFPEPLRRTKILVHFRRRIAEPLPVRDPHDA